MKQTREGTAMLVVLLILSILFGTYIGIASAAGVCSEVMVTYEANN